MRTIVLFALVGLVVAEPPLQRFRSRAGFGVQRPNGRFARLEEAPPAAAAEQAPAGYHYPKPTSSGYHYDKPAVPFPPPSTEQAPAAETTTTSDQAATTTESSDTMTTTAVYEDYEDSTAAQEPVEDSPSNAQLRRRQPLNVRHQQLNVRRQQVRLPVSRQNQRLEELPTVYVDEQEQPQQQLVRPVYLINLPESTLQQLVLLNNAQLQAGLQVAAPQPTAVYLSELDYIYKKK